MRLETIHKDSRGSINLILGDLSEFKEITVFKTVSGKARGGCVHNKHQEFCCVLEGSIEYYIGDDCLVMQAGEVVTIPQSTPHYFISITDSVVAEWGASPEEKQVKHLQFRHIVDEINNK